MSQPYAPIDCDRHDYLEIACLYRYEVELEYADGDRITGVAVTTRTDADKSEWLLLDHQEQRVPVRLDQIRSLRTLSPHARFSEVTITS